MCGIIGIFKTEGQAAPELYEGLLMLQHRGQDSAGMGEQQPPRPPPKPSQQPATSSYGNQRCSFRAARALKSFVTATPRRAWPRLPAAAPCTPALPHHSIPFRPNTFSSPPPPPPLPHAVTTDWAKFREYKDNGLVKDVFNSQEQLDKLKGK